MDVMGQPVTCMVLKQSLFIAIGSSLIAQHWVRPQTQ